MDKHVLLKLADGSEIFATCYYEDKQEYQIKNPLLVSAVSRLVGNFVTLTQFFKLSKETHFTIQKKDVICEALPTDSSIKYYKLMLETVIDQEQSHLEREMTRVAEVIAAEQKGKKPTSDELKSLLDQLDTSDLTKQ